MLDAHPAIMEARGVPQGAWPGGYCNQANTAAEENAVLLQHDGKSAAPAYETCFLPGRVVEGASLVLILQEFTGNLPHEGIGAEHLDKLNPSPDTRRVSTPRGLLNAVCNRVFSLVA